jgi:type II secretory pathway pseudopilin PulG
VSRILRSEKAFTLLEVMIAFAILAFILGSVFITQSASLSSSGRARQVITVTNLAKNFIAEREMLYENRPFDKIEEKQAGTFPAPHDQYKWKIEIAEVDFAPLTNLLLKASEQSGQMNGEQASMLLKFFEKYLKDSVRRMTVTIEYPDGKGTSSLTFTELLINYDAEFAGG